MPQQLDNTSPASDRDLFDRVAFVIDRIRPAVQEDGGDIELIEIKSGGIVRIKMHGACVGCPSSNMTLRIGIERNLKDRIPEIMAVESIDVNEPTFVELKTTPTEKIES
jgi:Fe-S cluster biogenesis protein NfuA